MWPFSLITSMSFVLEPNGPATRRGMQYARNKERKGGSFPYRGQSRQASLMSHQIQNRKKTNFTEISSYIDRTLLISNMHRPPSAFDLCIDIKNKSTGLKEDSYRTFFCVRTSSSITSRRCQSKWAFHLWSLTNITWNSSSTIRNSNQFPMSSAAQICNSIDIFTYYITYRVCTPFLYLSCCSGTLNMI